MDILKQIKISQKEIDGGKIIKGNLRDIIKNNTPPPWKCIVN